MADLILAPVIDGATGEVLDSSPSAVRWREPAGSPWRLLAALQLALLGAVLKPVASTALRIAGPVIIRHFCDPPRRRTWQPSHLAIDVGSFPASALAPSVRR